MKCTIEFETPLSKEDKDIFYALTGRIEIIHKKPTSKKTRSKKPMGKPNPKPLKKDLVISTTKKSIGRPKGSKNKVKPKKAGRPKGSKNKVVPIKTVGRPKGSKNKVNPIKTVGRPKVNKSVFKKNKEVVMKRWTTKEDKILNKNLNSPTTKLEKLLPNRSVDAIRRRKWTIRNT